MCEREVRSGLDPVCGPGVVQLVGHLRPDMAGAWDARKHRSTPTLGAAHINFINFLSLSREFR